MISFFRRALSSWVVLALLGLIMIAFIITGVSGPSALKGSADGGATVAKVGDRTISSIELSRRMQSQFDSVRRSQPTLEPKAFVAGGGFDQVTDALISARAIDVWGPRQGFAISKRLVDAEIAAIPAFRGVTGQFDENAMRAILAQQRVNERDLRNDIASDLVRGQILTPVIAAVPVPINLARPYASILLEQRTGQVGIIPLAAVTDKAQPSEADIAKQYKSFIAAYTRPETRILRYATFGTAQIAAKARPGDSDVAAYYQQHIADYTARQTRDLTQVILPTEAAAQAIAAKAQGGTPLATAATQAGVEATTLAKQAQADFAKGTNDAIAGATFTAAKGKLVGPIKGAFGWYVVRVDAIGGSPARSIDQARAEIVTALTKDKADAALSDLAASIETAVSDGASFAEVAQKNGLTVVTTPPVLQNGQADIAGWKTAPELQPLLRPAFDASPEDRPTVETIVKGQQYALLNVAQVIPPTPLPLAKVRDAVIRDIVITRTRAHAEALAKAITAKISKGMPIATAMATAGVPLPPVKPASARQLDLARADPRQIPPPVRAMFGMKPGQAKMMPADNGAAFFVVVLDKIVPGDVATVPGLVDSTRGELATAISSELAEQFVHAIQKDVGITRDAGAIAQVKRQFAGLR
jgi:peptidyl-prolyl cis-trans isomerase D